MNLRSILQSAFGPALAPASLAPMGAGLAALLRDAAAERLLLAAPSAAALPSGFHGEAQAGPGGAALLLCPRSAANLAALRAALPNLRPRPLGLTASAGCGDRLGLATPGHARAFHTVAARPGARPLAAIFAQQSIRENARTGRTPRQVLDDATWGAFEAGWRGPVGADADHLKTVEDVDTCVAAGYSFFTFDPGAHVDSAADTDPPTEIERKYEALPWEDLETSAPDLLIQYYGADVDLGVRSVRLEKEAVLRAAVKYGRAIAHVSFLYRRLAAAGVPFEVEVSVDETETPTTHAEHIYFAGELRRLGVRWVSLAPRYVGRFEKGIDYRGDLEALRADLAGHAAIARALGPYKLSLHSGSDKFSVYPLLVEAAGGAAHLKTAGTSYLEALRVLARAEPGLFRLIGALAAERYTADRATYHVSAELGDWPDLAALPDEALPALLDHDMPREILHVTFGSILARFGAELRAALAGHRAAYAEALEAHFIRHLAPFAGV
jgi:hypothetical protein